MKQDKRKLVFLLCVTFNLAVFLVLCIWGNPLFATNDDYRMRLIVSGSYTGTPDGHAVFISYILGSILAFLYKILPDIEWYGFFTMASMYVSVCLCEYIFLKRARRVKEFFERSLIIVIFTFLILQKHILMPQFTVTSAFWGMLAIAAAVEIFNIYHTNHRINWKWSAMFFISCLMSCLIRKKVFYMCIPMLILLLIVNWQRYRQVSRKGLILTVLAVGCVIILNEGTGAALNLNSEYKEFSEFNKARSSIYDYTGVPDYWEKEQFFIEIGVDGPAWENLNNRTFDISESLDAEKLETIYDHAKETENKNISYKIWKTINDIRSMMANKNIFFEIAAFLMVVTILLNKNSWKLRESQKKLLLCFLIYIIIATIGMAFVGRIVDRILEALLLFVIGAAFSLSSVSVHKKEETWFWIWKAPISSRLLLNIGILCILGIAVIANQYSLQRDESGLRGVVMKRTDCLNELTKYMSDKQEDFLFYNALDFISASEEVFTKRENKILNIDSLGNWNVFSPNYYKRNEKYGFSSAIEGLSEKDNVYYAEIGEYHANIGDELDKMDKKLSCIDELYVGEDTIRIYKVENKAKGE